ncbi:thioredoxin family protein [Sporichthya polymorpha]|uniref:thioredoxin family protein n=1 Tax=Sporichthya polymorpha TaxID=35751 RepID=UPI000381FBD0|nr:thioredoxin family protein [Sporichthya polymorpha]
MPIPSHMVPLGTPASDFSLPALDGRTVSLGDFAAAPALLVAFLCNHCPYVKHVESTLGPLLDKLADQGLASVGICSNDTDAYPDDGPEGLAEQVARAGFTFPYLIDATQEVAKAYRAACTPDFFLFDADRRLAWRGQFDESRPSTGGPVTGDTLREAVELVLAGQPVPEPHQPSAGCGIKWKPGNSPA